MCDINFIRAEVCESAGPRNGGDKGKLILFLSHNAISKVNVLCALVGGHLYNDVMELGGVTFEFVDFSLVCHISF